MSATIAAYGYGFKTAQRALLPASPLANFAETLTDVELQTDAPEQFDAYGRLIAYPGKVKIECPPQEITLTENAIEPVPPCWVRVRV
jgi:hypothetical protein